MIAYLNINSIWVSIDKISFFSILISDCLIRLTCGNHPDQTDQAPQRRRIIRSTNYLVEPLPFASSVRSPLLTKGNPPQPQLIFIWCDFSRKTEFGNGPEAFSNNCNANNLCEGRYSTFLTLKMLKCNQIHPNRQRSTCIVIKFSRYQISSALLAGPYR